MLVSCVCIWFSMLHSVALGPIPSSVSDFWQMVWDHKAAVIVMLAKVVEGRRVRRNVHSCLDVCMGTCMCGYLYTHMHASLIPT